MGKDTGIRVNVNNKFNELLPQREALGNTEFRRAVMQFAMEEFGINIGAAATHYNHAFKVVKAATPELVADLGRPEDKKGGRKPKAKPVPSTEVAVFEAPEQTEFTVCKKKDGEVVATGLSFEEAKKIVDSGRVKGLFCKTYFV